MVADAIGWALVQSGIPLQLHYLDDFLFFIPPKSTQSQLVLPYILRVLDSLGVPVAAQKIRGASDDGHLPWNYSGHSAIRTLTPATETKIHRWLGEVLTWQTLWQV